LLTLGVCASQQAKREVANFGADGHVDACG
jgi:hypothetical protein